MKTIRFECVNCGMSLEADARGAGQEVECPQCGDILTIPQAGAPSREAPPAPSSKSALEAPVSAARERLTPSTKFCIQCSRDVPDGNLTCPHCGGGRFGRL